MRLISNPGGDVTMAQDDTPAIGDCSRGGPSASRGSSWRLISDQVMGENPRGRLGGRTRARLDNAEGGTAIAFRGPQMPAAGKCAILTLPRGHHTNNDRS